MSTCCQYKFRLYIITKSDCIKNIIDWSKFRDTQTSVQNKDRNNLKKRHNHNNFRWLIAKLKEGMPNSITIVVADVIQNSVDDTRENMNNLESTIINGQQLVYKLTEKIVETATVTIQSLQQRAKILIKTTCIQT